MHSPGIQYCNTLCIRARIIVDGHGPAIETLPGLYLNKLAGRYEYLLRALGIMFTGGRTSRCSAKGAKRAVVAAAAAAGGRRYTLVIVGSESRVIALDNEADRCSSPILRSFSAYASVIRRRRCRRECHRVDETTRGYDDDDDDETQRFFSRPL